VSEGPHKGQLEVLSGSLNCPTSKTDVDCRFIHTATMKLQNHLYHIHEPAILCTSCMIQHLQVLASNWMCQPLPKPWTESHTVI
jgi:hypothetical protein